MKRYAVALIALLGAGLSVWASPAYRAELTVSGYAGEGTQCRNLFLSGEDLAADDQRVRVRTVL